MPRVFAYGEDGLTLKYTRERLGEILHELEDNSNPDNCTVFYRPSFGRRQYGEFDSIIISQEKVYFVEVKWDKSGDLSNGLEDHQIRRHKIFEWYIHNWNGEVDEAWNRFAKKNNPKFESIFSFNTKGGKTEIKSIPNSDTILGQNLQTILAEIGNRKIENVLLIFYRDVPPKVEQDGFSVVAMQYETTLGLFSELE